MADNPKLVIEEATGSSKKAPIALHDLTISRYAWLEKLGSPFISPGEKFTVANVVPSVWVMAASRQELKAKASEDVESLKFWCLEWADEQVGMEDLPGLIDAVSAKITALGKAAPKSGAQDPKN